MFAIFECPEKNILLIDHEKLRMSQIIVIHLSNTVGQFLNYEEKAFKIVIVSICAFWIEWEVSLSNQLYKYLSLWRRR